MPAPKGNKYAVGTARGPTYDLDKEAADLDEWSKNPDSTTLYAFTDEKPYCADSLQDFAAKSEVFFRALKKAKERIALHREEKLAKGEMHQAAWNRSARIYDHLLERKEDADKDADTERKAKLIASQPSNPLAMIIQRVDGATPDLIGRDVDPTN